MDCPSSLAFDLCHKSVSLLLVSTARGNAHLCSTVMPQTFTLTSVTCMPVMDSTAEVTFSWTAFATVHHIAVGGDVTLNKQPVILGMVSFHALAPILPAQISAMSEPSLALKPATPSVSQRRR